MPLDALRLCALSIDLDDIPHYHAIYGLPAPAPPTDTAVYDIALGRFAAFASEEDIPLTFFAIGADLAREQNAQALRRLAEQGHEIANHSLDHYYDLSRRPAYEIQRQLEEGAAAIEAAVKRRPVGFRAPGYVVNDEMFRILVATGHTYDSSVFPSPPYFLAKATAMAWIRARGRKSRSVQDHPRVLLSPTRPYRPGRPYHQLGDLPILELPVQVTRGPRLPFIGTALTVAGPWRARALTRLVQGEPLINLELHGIDLLEDADGLEALRGPTPDVGIPLRRKREIFSQVVRTLKKQGYRFVTLQQAAQEIEQSFAA